MHRPIGVILLAAAAGIAALVQLGQMLVYLGVVDFTIVGQDVRFPDPQWGAALWSLLIAGIWAWVALGFWNLRAYAVQFGIFISLGIDFADLGGYDAQYLTIQLLDHCDAILEGFHCVGTTGFVGLNQV